MDLFQIDLIERFTGCRGSIYTKRLFFEKSDTMDLSDMSCDSCSDDEDDVGFEILDPSNPKAHSKMKDGTKHAPIVIEDDENMELQEEEEEEGMMTTGTVRLGSSRVKLSNWALKFLTPKRKRAEIVEAPIEPLRDYILNDFTNRSVPTPCKDKEEEDDDVSSTNGEDDEEDQLKIEQTSNIPAAFRELMLPSTATKESSPHKVS